MGARIIITMFDEVVGVGDGVGAGDDVGANVCAVVSSPFERTNLLVHTYSSLLLILNNIIALFFSASYVPI